MLPAARQALRRIGRTCDVVTYLAEYTRRRLAGALGAARDAAAVDAGGRRRDVPPRRRRPRGARRHGLGERPVIVCVSRLVPRKGQDTLIRALPAVRAAVPDAALLMVGSGRYQRRARRAGRQRPGSPQHVVLTGGVPFAELPAHYAAGDVFAMPCRTRRGGLDVEGLGIVYLEASATGLPVLAGDSGGAPDAVLAGETGYVVDGRDESAVAERLVTLLRDPELRDAPGRAPAGPGSNTTGPGRRRRPQLRDMLDA